MGQIVKFAAVGVVLLGLWRATNGDLQVAIDAVWGLLDRAGDAAATVWESIL